MKLYRNLFKRWFDFVVSTLLFICLLPVFLLVILGLLIVNNGKPFFFQLRPGKDCRIFKVIKFKTMNDRRDAAGELLPDAQRLTAFGRFVRKTSLDEIPQLLNVIKGDMSLVGPRPLLIEYLPLYGDIHRHRHDVTPGITGWAQVNGRNSINWDQKFDLDIWYIENLSFKLDVKILFMTILKVFKSEGISADGHATMPTFIDYVKNKQKI